MKPPIVIYSDGGLELFDHQTEAERYLEPNDVKRGRVCAYDADGAELSFRVETVSQPVKLLGLPFPRKIEKVVFEQRIGQEKPEALRNMLIEALSHARSKTRESREVLAGLPLPELVQRASQFKK